MPKYIYKPIKKVIEDSYLENAKREIYGDLGPVDFDNARIVVTADTEDEALSIRKGITDIRMWVLESVEG